MTTRRNPTITALHTPAAAPIAYGIWFGEHLRLALTTRDVADLTGWTVREVRGAIDRGELCSARRGRGHLITAHDLLDFLGLLPDTDRKTA